MKVVTTFSLDPDILTRAKRKLGRRTMSSYVESYLANEIELTKAKTTQDKISLLKSKSVNLSITLEKANKTIDGQEKEIKDLKASIEKMKARNKAKKDGFGFIRLPPREITKKDRLPLGEITKKEEPKKDKQFQGYTGECFRCHTKFTDRKELMKHLETCEVKPNAE